MFSDKKGKEDLRFLGPLNFSSSSSILQETLIESKTQKKYIGLFLDKIYRKTTHSGHYYKQKKLFVRFVP